MYPDWSATPFWVKMICSFWGKLTKIIGWRHSSWKSWFHNCQPQNPEKWKQRHGFELSRGYNGSVFSFRFSSDDSTSIVKLEFTCLLLVVSTCFIALNLPYFITWCLTISKRIHVVMFATGSHASSSAHLRGTLYISKTIFSFNYCINFFLYSLTGVNFRRQLRSVFCKKDAGSAHKTVASKTMYSQVAMATPRPSLQCNGITAV